jgi:predicted small lipoprotein YifL
VATLRNLLCGMAVVTGVALLSGCGKKGALIPPEGLVPAAITDLSLAQKGVRFQVSWSAPSRQVSGNRLQDLAGFILLRHTVLPPDQDCEECPTAYTQLARIDLEYPQGVQRIGNRFLYEDYDLRRGKSYRYKVRSFNSEGVESKDSNKVSHTALTPPQPPTVEALPSPDGVVLAFVSPPPAEGTLQGYNIYRSKPGEEMPRAPMNRTPVSGKTYEDRGVMIGNRYSYTVTSVAIIKGETVESLPSNRVDGGIKERD